MKILAFFLGKGGVGKTTLALAYSRKASSRESETLLASLDPAHNVGDLLRTRLSEKPRKLEMGFSAVEVDLEEVLKRNLKGQVERIQQVFKELRVWNLEGHLNILRWMPGTEEQALLLEIERLSKENWSRVVFDMPPTGLALRVFLLPQLTLFWLNKLEELRARILDLRKTIASVRGEHNKEKDRVIEVIREQESRYRNIIDIFSDSESSHFFIIMDPSPLSLDEGIRISQSLEKNGITAKAVILNKFRVRKDRRTLQEVKERMKLPIFSIPYFRNAEDSLTEIAKTLPEEIL